MIREKLLRYFFLGTLVSLTQTLIFEPKTHSDEAALEIRVCVGGRCWRPADYRGNFLPGRSPFVYTSSNNLNYALLHAQRLHLENALTTAVQETRLRFQNSNNTLRENNESQIKALNTFQEQLETLLRDSNRLIQSKTQGGFLAQDLSPTEVIKIKPDLDPLWDSLHTNSDNPIETSEELNALLQKIQSYQKSDDPDEKAKAESLWMELRKTFIDHRGFLSNLPFVNIPAEFFASDIKTDHGLEIRTTFNTVLSMESVFGAHCSDVEQNSKASEACTRLKEHLNGVKLTLLFLDRIAGSSDHRVAFKNSLNSLQQHLSILKGYSIGVSKGIVQIVEDSVQTLIHLPSVIHSLYLAISNHQQSWAYIKNAMAQRYEEFLNAPPEEAGEIAGQFTVEVLSFFAGGTTLTKVNRAVEVQKAVILATDAAAIGHLAEKLKAIGQLSQEAATKLQAMTSTAPLLARKLNQLSMEQLEKGASFLSSEAINGIGDLTQRGGLQYVIDQFKLDPQHLAEISTKIHLDLESRYNGIISHARNTGRFIPKNANLDSVLFRSADEVNLKSFPHYSISPPYRKGTLLVEYTTKETESFVRLLSDPTKRPGQWLTKEENIIGLTPKQVKEKFSLPYEPTHFSRVTVKPGTKMRRGEIEANFGGNRIKTQYELAEPHLLTQVADFGIPELLR